MKKSTHLILLLLILILSASCTTKKPIDQFSECLGEDKYQRIHQVTVVLDSFILQKFETKDLYVGYGRFGKLFIDSPFFIHPILSDTLLRICIEEYKVQHLHKTTKIDSNEYGVELDKDFIGCLKKVDHSDSKGHAELIISLGFNLVKIMDMFYQAPKMKDDFVLEISKIEYVQYLLDQKGNKK